MSIQFPEGFKFHGNFLIALSFSTFRYGFSYEKKIKWKEGIKSLESKEKWYFFTREC